MIHCEAHIPGAANAKAQGSVVGIRSAAQVIQNACYHFHAANGFHPATIAQLLGDDRNGAATGFL